MKRFFKKKSEAPPPRRPTVKMKVPVYTDGTDEDRLSITRQIRDLPEPQKVRTGEIVLSKYERLFHSIYDSVMITDMDGEILEVNARAEYNFGYPKGDLCTMNVLAMISGADQDLLKVIRDGISTEKYLVVEAVCVRSDESRFNAEIMVNSLSTLEGDMLCYFFRDISARKEAEQQLAEANAKILDTEKVNARLDTISTLVYELNNPLQILACMADAEGNKDLTKQVQRIVAVIDKLHVDVPLRTVTDAEGATRYDLPERKLQDCDYKRFLVADDEMMLRQMFLESLSLSFPHAQVEAAADGRQAVDLFQQRRHGLIIMDLAMPVMSGEEAFEEIMAICEREGWNPPTFIFCTGFVPSEKIKNVVGDESMHSCLRKPFTTGDLTRSVRNRLSRVTEVDI